LRALLPLSGRTLVEYQVRCAAAAGAAPIIVVVERVPQLLQDALERLRLDGVNAIAVSDVQDAVSRFEAGSQILMIGDGIAPAAELVAHLADDAEPVVATVPDEPGYAGFERIDGEARWAGIALIDANMLGSTAAMLGDWDLISTLLRRTLQGGARRISLDPDLTPLLANTAEDLAGLQRKLLLASRAARDDWASCYVLAPVEDIATTELLQTEVTPGWLLWSAIALIVVAALCFTRGWLGAGLGLLVLSTPLDLIAGRLATLRLRPLAPSVLARRLLWPLSGLAMLALGWWEARHNSGWGAGVTAICAIAFAEAARVEKRGAAPDVALWLFSRRNAVLAAVPFAIAGSWTAYLMAMLAYAALSFFLVQHVQHSGQLTSN
jgi:hypothetical protein